MLIYHPAYDAYHCLFRMIVLINNIDTIEIEKARILDFYLTFPSLVEKIRMPQNHSHIKKIAKKYFNDYRNPINSITVFQDMHQIQISAIRCLAATGLIELAYLDDGLIKRTDKKIPEGLLLPIMDFLDTKKDIYNFIVHELSKLHLTGKDGLKDRTSLLEYRYDHY